MPILRFGALDSRHRRRLAEILAGTGAFSSDEIEVALELFDETFGERATRGEGRTVVDRNTSAPLTPPHPSPLEPRSSYEFLGAYDERDQLVGYACYGLTPSTDGTFDLYWIAVDKEAQGSGCGRRLLDEVEAHLRSRGARLVVAETSSRADYEPTRRFYAARGYHEAARVAAFYGPLDDRLIYVKRLARTATPADRPSSTP